MVKTVDRRKLMEIITSRWTGDEEKEYGIVGYPVRDSISCPSCPSDNMIYGKETVSAGESPFVFEWEKTSACEVEYIYCSDCGLRRAEIDGDSIQDTVPDISR